MAEYGFPGVAFVRKLFAVDRPAREAFPLLVPGLLAGDLASLDPSTLGVKIADLAERLYEKGSLPGLPTWEWEASVEIVESIAVWRRALNESSSRSFAGLARRAAVLAEAGYCQLGRLAPRLAALRWLCCISWIASRAETIDSVSAGGAVGTMDPSLSAAAMHDAKTVIVGWIKNLLAEAQVLAIFDFDLVGHGVWHTGGREQLPPEAENEWFRRGVEFDIALLSYQARMLEPLELNSVPAVLLLRMPHGSSDWELLPHEAPRHIVEKHQWLAEVKSAPIDGLPEKVPLRSPVLHCNKPPPPQPDLDDIEVVQKIQRGEPLGKAHQEDGLPGALHPSVGLLFAAIVAVEDIENVSIYPGLLEIEGFFEAFLQHCHHISALDCSGCAGLMDEACLRLLPLTGESLTFLDLEDCGLKNDYLEALTDSLRQLSGLRHVDLAGNSLDGAAATCLMTALSLSRFDVASIRLDGNPIGDLLAFRDEVNNGGNLMLLPGERGARWQLIPRQGSVAARAYITGVGMPAYSLKDVHAEARRRESVNLKQLEDPEMVATYGRKFLTQQQKMNARVLGHPVVQIWREARLKTAKTSSPDRPEATSGKRRPASTLILAGSAVAG